jgi:hypothetical protein
MFRPPQIRPLPLRFVRVLRPGTGLRLAMLTAITIAVAMFFGPAHTEAAAPGKAKDRPATANKTPPPPRDDDQSAPDKNIYRLPDGKAHTSMFGIDAEGYKFVYVLDRSASMGGPGSAALKAAKAELIASLNNLERTHQFQIVVYNDRPAMFNPTGDPQRAVFATDRNKEEAAKFIDSITPFGGTQHDDALVMAVKLSPSVIFWLTDADDPKLGPAKQERINRMAAGITIHAIEFGSGQQSDADNFLVKIARENGGKHTYIDVSKLPAATGGKPR